MAIELYKETISSNGLLHLESARLKTEYSIWVKDWVSLGISFTEKVSLALYQSVVVVVIYLPYRTQTI